MIKIAEERVAQEMSIINLKIIKTPKATLKGQ